MKRSRSEPISSHVNILLKRRQYQDNDHPKKCEVKNDQALMDMAVDISVLNRTTSKNMYAFSSINSDLNAVEIQYSRFKGFVSDSCEPMKTELTHLLFPTFFYSYKELATLSKQAAKKFFHKNIQLFNNNSLYEPILSKYFHNLTSDNLNENDDGDTLLISEVDSSKFKVKLTRQTHEYLLRFFKSCKQNVLLQIFNRNMLLQVTPIEICEDYVETCASNDSAPCPKLNGNIDAKENKKDAKISAEDALEEAIRKVQGSKPCLPSICNYSLSSPSVRVCSIDISSDLKMICAGFTDSSVRLFNLTPLPLFSPQTKPSAFTLNLSCDTEEPHDCETVDCDNSDIEVYTKVLRGHSGTVYSAKFLSGNKSILSCSRDATVRAWSLDTFTNTAVYLGHNYPIWSLDVSQMGHYFVTASQDHTARLWSFDRSFPLRMFGDGHNIDVDSVSFHPNCNYVATGSSDRTVRLWDVQSGESVRSYYGSRNSVMALAFSPNGKFLAAAGEDRKIKIWDLGSGSILKDLRGHSDTIYALKFSPDSSILASGGADESVRLWDITKESCSNTPSVNANTSPELLSSHSIKSCSILSMRYTDQNVLYTSGKAKQVAK